MFETLGKKLNGVFRTLSGQGKLTESNIRDAMREVRMALLEADVNYKVVKDFVARVTQESLGAEVLESIKPSEHIIGLVHRELINLLGGEVAPFALKPGQMNVILLLGLQGSGKTTFAGKLAMFWKKQGWRPLLVACDIHRPAAIKQLHVVGQGVGVPTFDMGTDKTPSEITRNAIELAKREDKNLVIVDTAGRLHIDEVRMDELEALKSSAKPTFTFLVSDAMTGQDAVNSASRFNEAIGIDGVCLTKLDGDARGGAALSIREVTGRPIYYVGVGEKSDDLEVFYPDRMASRILGMGDIVTLFEKAQETFDEEQAMEMAKKIKRQSFTLSDFLDQMQQVRKMGPLKKIMGMLPGVGQMLEGQDIDEKEFGRVEAIIQSMTPAERNDPTILNGNRKKRIADGSGTTPQAVNALLTQFEQAKKLMKMLSGGAVPGMPGIPGMPAPKSSSGSNYQKPKKRKEKPKRHHRR